MTKTIEDITNFIFIGKPIEELSHYDLLIINADWVEEQLSKDIRIMKEKSIIDDNTIFIICPLASYAGDKLSREEPFSFTDIIFALLCAIIIPLLMALKDKNKE